VTTGADLAVFGLAVGYVVLHVVGVYLYAKRYRNGGDDQLDPDNGGDSDW